MNKGRLLVLVGPSGSGKGTVLKAALAAMKSTFLSISATTRAPREGERQGEQYYFVSREEFQSLIEQDGLLEYAVYVDNYYGTPKQPVLDRLAAGQNVILEIEVQGARSIKQKYPEAVMLFILPPSVGELRRRLAGRNTEPADVVEKRLQKAREEFGFARECDYVIINDVAEEAAARLCAVLTALSCERDAMAPEIERVMES